MDYRIFSEHGQYDFVIFSERTERRVDLGKIFDNIKRRANEQGKSVNKVEVEAGISAGSTYKWNTVSPTIKNLKSVADVLHCTIEELISDD